MIWFGFFILIIFIVSREKPINNDIGRKQEEIAQTMGFTSPQGSDHSNYIYIELLNRHFNIIELKFIC
jgi:hypothetical protein